MTIDKLLTDLQFIIGLSGSTCTAAKHPVLNNEVQILSPDGEIVMRIAQYQDDPNYWITGQGEYKVMDANRTCQYVNGFAEWHKDQITPTEVTIKDLVNDGWTKCPALPISHDFVPPPSYRIKITGQQAKSEWIFEKGDAELVVHASEDMKILRLWTSGKGQRRVFTMDEVREYYRTRSNSK